MTRRQLERLLARMEPKLRAAFLQLVGLVQDTDNVEELSLLLEHGRIDDALRLLPAATSQLASAWAGMFNLSAEETVTFLNGLRGIVVDYDQTNLRAVEAMRRNRLRLVRELSEQQREATRAALEEGIRRGDNPRAQARRFRDSIGLSPSQQRAMENYRRSLETGDRDALRRALRDSRFDASALRAASGEELAPRQIDRMVGRYRDRLLAQRAEVIARTEALRAVHEGSQEMFQQAIDSGNLDPKNLVRVWNTASDRRVRHSHVVMNGQRRAWDEPFTTGAGYHLRYPGDTNAPASETVQCRCVVSTRVESVGAPGLVVVG